MATTYLITQEASGWIVREGDEPVRHLSNAADALETACLLTLASKAAGRAATLMLPDGDGVMRAVDVDRPIPGYFTFDGHSQGLDRRREA